MKYPVHLLFFALIFIGCADSEEPILDNRYLSYLDSQYLDQSSKELEEQLTFWREKERSSPSNSVFMHKLASLEAQRFDLHHDLSALKSSDEMLLELKNRFPKDVSVLHALIQNSIKRHAFNAALDYANQAFEIGEKKDITQLLLVDIYLEKGRLSDATDLLSSLGKSNRFDRQIRWVKIYDASGDLNKAVEMMEAALENAEASNSDGLKLWAYSNLGDMYGHQGEIKASYESYLKALTVSPSDAHSIKGIGWIAFSHDASLDEAERIWSFLKETDKNPEFDLLLSDLYESKGQMALAEAHKNEFIQRVDTSTYGNMYGSHLVDLLSNPDEGLIYAEQDIKERTHPVSYAHLALAAHRAGETARAVYLLNTKVRGRTEEPTALWIMGEVYQEAGEKKSAKNFLSEALEASYELGPVKTAEVKARLLNI